MITENVLDALDDGFRCSLMALCTVKASPDYQLKPARDQKTQAAFEPLLFFLLTNWNLEVLISLQCSWWIPFNASQTQRLRRRQSICADLSTSANMQGNKEQSAWTEQTSPANAGKCRRLGKAPTDDLLDQYQAHK